jgi:hypothetical protein
MTVSKIGRILTSCNRCEELLVVGWGAAVGAGVFRPNNPRFFLMNRRI